MAVPDLLCSSGVIEGVTPKGPNEVEWERKGGELAFCAQINPLSFPFKFMRL